MNLENKLLEESSGSLGCHGKPKVKIYKDRLNRANVVRVIDSSVKTGTLKVTDFGIKNVLSYQIRVVSVKWRQNEEV